MAKQPQKKRITRRKGTEKFGRRRLEVRNAMIKDIRGIADLVRRVYEDMPAYTHGEIRGQINNFREGCFVALLDDEVVGYCATMQLAEAIAFQPHDWDEITGNGGDDLFVFTNGTGDDVITDFAAGAGSDDVIDVTDFGFTDLADLLAATNDSGADTVITLDGDDSLTLIGVQEANLHEDDSLI